jgi:hypothetical protein
MNEMTQERSIIETMFRIPDKSGRDVDFYLNTVQAKLDSELTGRDVIPKARQRGISYYYIARWVAKCLSQRNRRCVMVSHSAKATQLFLDRAHYILNHLRGGVEADLKYSSRNELHFRKTDSVLYIGTAGSDNVGVGDTITDLHCSEVSSWDDPAPLLKGLFNAVPPDGEIAVESTGKGQGNWFHRTVLRAANGASRYKLHFFSWIDAEEYTYELDNEERADLLANLDEELEEPQLYKNKVLTLEQIAWRRDKLEEMDYDLQAFKEQYPITLDECFQGTGGSYFNRINFVNSPMWRLHPTIPNFWVLGDHPKRGKSYVGGLDSGGGTGRDNSTLELICIDDMEQVGEWASNRFEPHIFGEKMVPILYLFNKAYINIERNNHGILTIKTLLDLYKLSRIHMTRPPLKEIKEYGKIADYGTYTSVGNRLQVLGSLRELAVKELTIHSPLLKGEMDSFVEKDSGKVEAQEGCFDDRVMAAAHATYVLPRAAGRTGYKRRQREREKESDPFSLNTILKELEGKYETESR